MLVPLYGFVEGDTMGVLVLAHDDMTVEDVIGRLRESARIRVDTSGDWELRVHDRKFDPKLTVAQLRLRALQRIDLRRSGPK